jgi:hypothetical protein
MAKKYLPYLFLSTPFLFFYIIFSFASDAEELPITTCTNDKAKHQTSLFITINEVNKDYVYCDVELSCPINTFESLTISTNSITGKKIVFKEDQYKNQIESIHAKIDFFKTTVYKLDDKILRNKTANRGFYNLNNVRLLIPVEAYKSPVNSINANLHLLLTKKDGTIDSIETLNFRNLDKNQRISILGKRALVRESAKNPEFKIFASPEFNMSFHLMISPNVEALIVILTLLTFIIVILFRIHWILLRYKSINSGIISILLTVTLGVVSLIAIFQNKIIDTKSIAELIIYAIYFWIIILLIHSVLLLNKEIRSKGRKEIYFWSI